MTTTQNDPTTHPTPDGRATMKAIVQASYGTDPDRVLELTDVARPSIGDDQVLVRVAAASVDMGTWHCMTGLPYAMRLAGFGVRAPKATNPGRCLAGTVELVGGKVTGFAPGDEVFGTCRGSFAQYVCVDPSRLAHKPLGVSFEHAAAAPISGATALQAIRKAGVRQGHRVLIIGASGGVGSFAVQMAKAAGAEVTGVCSAAKADLVRSLGADHVVDYAGGSTDGVAPRYDAIIDIAGNRPLRQLRRALTRRGTLVIVGGETDGRWFGGVGRSLRAVLLSPLVRQRLTMLASSENAGDMEAVAAMICSGSVTPAIDRTFPLDDAAAAIRYLRAGHARGKVVIAL